MSNYLKFSQHYYELEWIRSDMSSKLSEYKVKTKFKLDYSLLEKKLQFISSAQSYMNELYESDRINAKRNFDLEHILLDKTAKIKQLEQEIVKLNQEKEF